MVDSIWEKITDPCCTFMIAEAGVNHYANPELAKKLVDAAINAEADAVKFQAFEANRLVVRDALKANYQLNTSNATRSQHEMLQLLELTPEAHQKL